MHGMLSTAVMLAAFAVIALVGGVSAVWLFRTAAATPRRSHSARLAGMPGAAADRAPGASGGSSAPGVPAQETGGLEAEYPERPRPGAAPAGPGQPAVHDGLAGPDDPAAPPGAGGGYDPADMHDPEGVYDLEDWPGTEGSRDGHGRSSPGQRAWPDTAKSLYSRGWPAMDSSPDARGPRPAPDGTETAAARAPDVAAEEDPPGRPEGARVYVLGESRRPGP